MESFLTITQVVISILLVLAVLLQQRGSGLSATFGGSGGFYASKRGAEKYLERATLILAIMFVGNAIAFLFL